MPGNYELRVAVHLVLLFLFAAFAQFAWPQEAGRAKEQAERQVTQPLNNAPLWRDVRSGQASPYQTTTVRGVDTNVLIQTQGQIWREIRNGPVTVYGGWLIIIVPLLIGLYYLFKGPLKLRDKPTGRMIQRFSTWERIVHWTTAISFVILAVTGLVILFGKYVLLPILGYSLFSWLATLSKYLHNFVGPLFVIGTVLTFISFVKDSVPKAIDWLWIRKAGGLFSGEHVPAGKFNAGQKVWFWVGVTALGVALSATGLVMLFPNFEQGRLLMQQMTVIHAVAGVLFIAMAFGHIYIGTIGMERAYEAMRNGQVDETWAKEHHEYWYDEVVRGKEQAPATGGAPSTAPASALREGWKL
jgi:formate dehydrogenase subunit gamma